MLVRLTAHAKARCKQRFKWKNFQQVADRVEAAIKKRKEEIPDGTKERIRDGGVFFVVERKGSVYKVITLGLHTRRG